MLIGRACLCYVPTEIWCLWITSTIWLLILSSTSFMVGRSRMFYMYSSWKMTKKKAVWFWYDENSTYYFPRGKTTNGPDPIKRDQSAYILYIHNTWSTYHTERGSVITAYYHDETWWDQVVSDSHLVLSCTPVGSRQRTHRRSGQLQVDNVSCSSCGPSNQRCAVSILVHPPRIAINSAIHNKYQTSYANNYKEKTCATLPFMQVGAFCAETHCRPGQVLWEEKQVWWQNR